MGTGTDRSARDERMQNQRIVVRAPAKVNLALRVGPLRSDGYHELVTVFHAVSLFDTVTVEPARDFTVTVRGAQAAQVPADGTNLAVRAARLLARTAGVTAGAALTIDKGIPVAGGMAGGSADAAAALVGCDALWGTGFTLAELTGIAAELGADVPFSLLGGTAIGTGRGEELTPVLTHGTLHWALALPTMELSTPAVFREFDLMHAEDPAEPPAVPPRLLAALTAADTRALAGQLDNDLQPAALRLQPGLAATLTAGSADGALAAVVSGSGPTVAFLLPAPAHELPSVVGPAVREVVRCHGPVPGARLVEPGVHYA